MRAFARYHRRRRPVPGWARRCRPPTLWGGPTRIRRSPSGALCGRHRRRHRLRSSPSTWTSLDVLVTGPPLSGKPGRCAAFRRATRGRRVAHGLRRRRGGLRSAARSTGRHRPGEPAELEGLIGTMRRPSSRSRARTPSSCSTTSICSRSMEFDSAVTWAWGNDRGVAAPRFDVRRSATRTTRRSSGSVPRQVLFTSSRQAPARWPRRSGSCASPCCVSGCRCRRVADVGAQPCPDRRPGLHLLDGV